MNDFIPILKNITPIFRENENVALKYESQLFEKRFIAFRRIASKDRIIQYKFGIHKDDLVFEIDGFPIKNLVSARPTEIILIALKLAQFEFMKKQSGELPILLLMIFSIN